MGKAVVGEIVVLLFPQTDLQAGKRRPALVVGSPRGPDLILCQITSQRHKDPYAVPLTRADFVRCKFAVEGFVLANRVITVPKAVILYTAGKIKPSKLNEVRAKLRALFRT